MSPVLDWIYRHPALYEVLQKAANLTARCHPPELLRILGEQPCDSVLDVGCGTGEIADSLGPAVSYVGIDSNEAFIRHARSHRRGRMVCADVTRQIPDLGRTFHTALFLGVLHHLDDAEVLQAWARVRPLVTSRVVIMEPCRPEKPDLRYALYALLEQGRFVRTPQGWLELFGRMGLNASETGLVTMRNLFSRKIVCCLHPRIQE